MRKVPSGGNSLYKPPLALVANPKFVSARHGIGRLFRIFRSTENQRLIAVGVAVIFLLKGVANFVQAYFMSRVGNAIIADRQRKIYDRILAQGIEFYHATSSSDLITRMTNNAQAARSVLDLVVTSYVRDLVTLIVLVLVMIWQQPALSLI
ncbi:MAG: hypothetical protein E5W30_09695, partial [Mesorhizobium sp.]